MPGDSEAAFERIAEEAAVLERIAEKAINRIAEEAAESVANGVDGMLREALERVRAREGKRTDELDAWIAEQVDLHARCVVEARWQAARVAEVLRKASSDAGAP